MKFWQGKFNEGIDATVAQYISTFSFDKRLYKHDIMGSIAHCTMLGNQGLIDGEEVAQLQKALTGIFYDITAGKIVLENAGNIFDFLDKEICERVGSMGEKINIGRCKTDRAELAMRMYVSETIDDILFALKTSCQTIISLADNNLSTAIPTFILGAKGQPSSLAHIIMSYAERFVRDIERLLSTKERTLVMPLYSQYGTGTRLPIDKKKVAELLKFKTISANTYDAISDNDYSEEFLANCAIVFKHLIAICNEIIKWTDKEFGFAKTDGNFNVDSPIVPQTDIQSVLQAIKSKAKKGLTLATSSMYNTDSTFSRGAYETIETVFEVESIIKNCLNMFATILPSFTFDEQAMLKQVNAGFTTAYDCVEYLISKGVTESDAYAITGKICEYCVENMKRLDTINLDTYKEFSDVFENDILLNMRPKTAIRLRKHDGEPSDVSVRAEIRNMVRKLNKLLP